MTMINWTPEMLQRLKQAHKAALEAKVEAFTFDTHEFNTAYAGYLIEYLEGEFITLGNKPAQPAI